MVIFPLLKTNKKHSGFCSSSTAKTRVLFSIYSVKARCASLTKKRNIAPKPTAWGNTFYFNSKLIITGAVTAQNKVDTKVVFEASTGWLSYCSLNTAIVEATGIHAAIIITPSTAFSCIKLRKINQVSKGPITSLIETKK